MSATSELAALSGEIARVVRVRAAAQGALATLTLPVSKRIGSGHDMWAEPAQHDMAEGPRVDEGSGLWFPREGITRGSSS